MKFRIWLESQITYNYDRNVFVKLPWNWTALQQAGVVQPLYYSEGEPSDTFSLITLPNLKSIPPNQLSKTSQVTGAMPDQSRFLSMLRNPQAWYDDKINQVYQGIQMVGKKPEDFGGNDIRRNMPV